MNVTVVQVMYRFHLYTTAALQRVHTAANLSELGRLGNEFLELLTGSPLYTVRPSQYLFVKAHLFVCHLCLAIRNMGSLSNMGSLLRRRDHVLLPIRTQEGSGPHAGWLAGSRLLRAA